MAFHKLQTSLPDVIKLQPDVFGDDRGFFLELHNANAFQEIGLGQLHFVQDNLSSSTKGTLRGLHFQAPPYDQGKLICPLVGKVLDVAVDIRKDSPTYGQVMVEELDASTRTMIYIPPGFAHGFQVLSDECLFFYKCTNVYHKASEGGLAWDDPELAIPWREIEPIMSEKDLYHPTLAEFSSPFDYVSL
ncbi:MAG: dTDP-4-dehydrorhamnose 3,5-epimerase [Bacteroidota bacterium]